MPVAKNHEVSRKSVCLLCMQKGSGPLTPTVISRIQKYVGQNICFKDSRVPSAICSTCRLTLQEHSTGVTKHSFPILFDFSSIVLPINLRSSPLSCNCIICKVSRSGPQGNLGHHPIGLQKKKKGRPTLPESKYKETSFNKSPSVPQKQCPKCLTAVGPGKPHICTPSTRNSNLKKLVELFPKDAEKVASSILKKKEASPGGTIRLSQFSGRLMPVMPGSSSTLLATSPQILTTSEMINIQQTTKMSNNNMRQLASCINRAAPKGGGVEPYFQENFAKSGKSLEEFFVSSNHQLDLKGQLVERTIIACKDCDEFVQHILHLRNVSPFDTLVKLSMDNGGGFFKICLGMTELPEETSISPAKKKKKPVNEQSHLSSGVKKIFILLIAEEITENYSNIAFFLQQLNLENIKLIIACDLKVANILCGIQSHASKHPCCFCDVNSDNLLQSGALRTFGSLRYYSEQFKSSTSKQAKLFFNCTKEPLIQEENETRVIDIIPPPELHLLIGVVNHLFGGLKTAWPFAENWPVSIYVKTVAYHGGESFNGPACHRLLNNIDKLEEIAQSNNAFQVQPWITAFRDFKAVVHSCFGMNLDEDFVEKIVKFKSSVKNLPISVTPKLHILFHHVQHFIEKEKKSLGLYSEQASETVHHDFKTHWVERYKRQIDHPDYAKQLLNSVIEYNSKHI